jgi:stage II sporulation protein P
VTVVLKAKNLPLTLLLIIAMAWVIITVAGNRDRNATVGETSEPTDDIGPDETENYHSDNGEMGDFPLFLSGSELSPPPEAGNETEKKPVVLPTTIEGGLTIKNDTSYTPDLTKIMGEKLLQALPSEGTQVLIIHTHGSEAYMPDRANNYTPSDTFRTEDKKYSIIRVGDELTACLESYGITVLHDREIYDYPSYTGCYARSAEAISAHLKEHPEIAVVLDVHRDALGDGDVVYKTVAEGSGQPSSQLMLLVGTGENGLEHPKWIENLKFALYLQSAVVDKYPTLARPIAVKKERYNQHMTTGSLILEVGSNGNSLSEALCAVRLFADAIAPKLLELVK